MKRRQGGTSVSGRVRSPARRRMRLWLKGVMRHFNVRLSDEGPVVTKRTGGATISYNRDHQVESQRPKPLIPPLHLQSPMPSQLEVADNRPCFFRIISDGMLHEALRIPPEFVKDYLSTEASNHAVLKGPSGDCWETGLRRDARGLFLEDGWQQFVRDHSLGNNEFLVFRYDGHMCFDIQIFEKTGCEKDIIRVMRHGCASSGGKRPRGRPRKFPVGSCNHRPGKSPETGKIMDLTAENFTSNLPFLKLCMKEYHIKGTSLHISKSLAKAHFPPFEATFTLQTAEGKSWKVKSLLAQNKYFFTEGWRKFVHENKLEVGHTCIFELVAPQKLQVHIFQ